MSARCCIEVKAIDLFRDIDRRPFVFVAASADKNSHQQNIRAWSGDRSADIEVTLFPVRQGDRQIAENIPVE
jgi:hypothetical protein